MCGLFGTSDDWHLKMVAVSNSNDTHYRIVEIWKDYLL
jgi:hypothetical protein